MVCITINYLSVLCHICLKGLYFNKLFPLSAVLRQTRNTSKRPFYGLTESFVLDLKEIQGRHSLVGGHLLVESH